MSFRSTTYRIMIASPSDVAEERKLISDCISEWNSSNTVERNVNLVAISWEINSTPDLTAPAQQIINDTVLKNCDILIGVFWTRIGTPTTNFKGGTVEEIMLHWAKKRPVMLYFSNKPTSPSSLDIEQITKVSAFKRDISKEGLVQEYNDVSELKALLLRHLTAIVLRLEYRDPVGANEQMVQSLGLQNGTILSTEHLFLLKRFDYAAKGIEELVELKDNVITNLPGFSNKYSTLTPELYLSRFATEFHGKRYQHFRRIRFLFEIANELLSGYSGECVTMLNIKQIETHCRTMEYSVTKINKFYKELWQHVTMLMCSLLRISSKNETFWIEKPNSLIIAEKWGELECKLAMEYFSSTGDISTYGFLLEDAANLRLYHCDEIKGYVDTYDSRLALAR